MNSIPLFRRKGSLLIPSDTHIRGTPRASSTPAESCKKPPSRKRKGYSEHHVLSPAAGQVCLPDRLHESMLAWADTEPGVLAVTLVDLAVVYQDAGRTKTTRVPLRVTFRTGVLAYWDCAFADPGDGKWSAALAAKREFARASDAEYRVMTWRFFADHRLELQGRLALQNVLYSGRAVDTSAEEASVLLHVGRAPHTVEALAATLGYTDPVAMLVVARLWRAGMVVLPLAAAGLNMQWQVSRRVRYGR